MFCHREPTVAQDEVLKVPYFGASLDHVIVLYTFFL